MTTCKSCYWWEQGHIRFVRDPSIPNDGAYQWSLTNVHGRATEDGDCRYNPPVAAQGGDSEPFPRTHPFYWCRMYKHKEDLTPEVT